MEERLLQIGQRLRARRVELGWSIRLLAEKSGLSQRYLISAEHGQANLSLQKLENVAQAMRISTVSLVAKAPLLPILSLLESQTQEQLREISSYLRQRIEQRSKHEQIALLGVRGAGKSTVGQLLASLLNFRFVELDHEIERVADLKLADMFAWHGEGYYRKLERRVLGQVLNDPRPTVIATGGGIVTHEETFSFLQAKTTTVWLAASAETHWSRVVAQGDARPMLNHPHAMAELRALLASRTAAYETADLCIQTDEMDEGSVARSLAKSLH